MKTVLKLLIILLSIGYVGCQDDDSITQGPQGEQGPPGPQGEPGEPGNANVISSDWLSLEFAVRDTIIDNSNLKVTHFKPMELTENILENGAILIYMRFGPTIVQLPYTSYAGNKPSTISYLPRPQKLFITRFTHDNSGSLGFGAVQFKYILIPPAGKGKTSKNGSINEKLFEIKNSFYTLNELKLMNYEEISILLNLVEE